MLLIWIEEKDKNDTKQKDKNNTDENGRNIAPEMTSIVVEQSAHHLVLLAPCAEPVDVDTAEVWHHLHLKNSLW